MRMPRPEDDLDKQSHLLITDNQILKVSAAGKIQSDLKYRLYGVPGGCFIFRTQEKEMEGGR